MTPRWFDRLSLIAFVVSVPPAASGCGIVLSSELGVEGSEQGRAAVDLMWPYGAIVELITFEIEGPTIKSASVSSATSGTTFAIDGLNAGSDYSIVIKAKQSNGAAECVGSAMFSIVAGSTTNVNVELSCPGIRKNHHGSLTPFQAINLCAVINETTSIALGEGAVHQLIATASDEDMVPNGVVNYVWSAPSGSGTFDRPTSAAPKFTCAIDGAVKLTLKVDDGDCGTMKDVEVTCKKSGMPGAGSGDEDAGAAGSGGA